MASLARTRRLITVIFIIMAMMFITTMGHEVIVHVIIQPRSMFGFLFISVIVSGLLTTLIFEKLDLSLLG